jgi:anti-sigma factor RsiW
MDCSRFLSHYSEFRDGLITDPLVLLAMERHRRGCRRCARYHAAVSRGVDTLRVLDEIEPSPAFRRELRARLAAAVLSTRGQPALTPAGWAAAVLVAVAGALLVYEGVVTRRSAELAADQRLVPMVIANPSVPFVSFTRSDAPRPSPLVLPVSTIPAGAEAEIAP